MKHIQGDAQLAQIKQQHLSQWPKILFGNNPIDAGVTYEENVDKLLDSNPELGLAVADVPEFSDSFFHQAAPRPLPNQQAILAVIAALAQQDKNGLAYVAWACGYGKTTCMLELGHSIAQVLLPPKGRQRINVRMVLANPDLLDHYQQLFAEK